MGTDQLQYLIGDESDDIEVRLGHLVIGTIVVAPIWTGFVFIPVDRVTFLWATDLRDLKQKIAQCYPQIAYQNPQTTESAERPQQGVVGQNQYKSA